MSTKREPVSALIGLGGNVGDVVRAMQRALDAIDHHSDCRVISVSGVYRTPPWGKTDQNWFSNACAEVATDLEPAQFMDLLLTIEIAQGRVREERWGPRTLDLDIIAFGNEVIETDRLTVPHPRFQERAFVVRPLIDICPDRIIATKSVSAHAEGLDMSEIVQADEALHVGATSLS